MESEQREGVIMGEPVELSKGNMLRRRYGVYVHCNQPDAVLDARWQAFSKGDVEELTPPEISPNPVNEIRRVNPFLVLWLRATANKPARLPKPERKWFRSRLAHFGVIDLRAQDQGASAPRSDTPNHFRANRAVYAGCLAQGLARWPFVVWRRSVPRTLSPGHASGHTTGDAR
jgi:hypothetical protein